MLKYDMLWTEFPLLLISTFILAKKKKWCQLDTTTSSASLSLPPTSEYSPPLKRSRFGRNHKSPKFLYPYRPVPWVIGAVGRRRAQLEVTTYRGREAFSTTSNLPTATLFCACFLRWQVHISDQLLGYAQVLIFCYILDIGVK